MGGVVSHFLFQPPMEATPMDKSKVIWIETKLGSRIPACFIEYPRAKYTILYSHGNAEDLGMIHPFLVDVGRVLKVNMLAFDYTGYGFSKEENAKREYGSRDVSGEQERMSFEPSEEHCYADITAAFDYLTCTQNIPPSKIVIYGRSVGSGPSVYLAQKQSKEGQEVAGLVLHSPFMSVCRVVVDLGFTLTGDMFPNIDRMHEVTCPIYIIHGTKDEIVPFYHGEELYKTVSGRSAMPFWAEGMGHNDIEVKMPTAYIKRLYRFISQIDKQAKTKAQRALALSNSMSSDGEELQIDRSSSNLDLSRSDSSMDVSDWAPSAPAAPQGSTGSPSFRSQPRPENPPRHRPTESSTSGPITAKSRSSTGVTASGEVRNGRGRERTASPPCDRKAARERTVSPPRDRKTARERTVSPPHRRKTTNREARTTSPHNGGRRTTGLSPRRGTRASSANPSRAVRTASSPHRSRAGVSPKNPRQRSLGKTKRAQESTFSARASRGGEGRSPSPTRVPSVPRNSSHRETDGGGELSIQNSSSWQSARHSQDQRRGRSQNRRTYSSNVRGEGSISRTNSLTEPAIPVEAVASY